MKKDNKHYKQKLIGALISLLSLGLVYNNIVSWFFKDPYFDPAYLILSVLFLFIGIVLALE